MTFFTVRKTRAGRQIGRLKDGVWTPVQCTPFDTRAEAVTVATKMDAAKQKATSTKRARVQWA